MNWKMKMLQALLAINRITPVSVMVHSTMAGIIRVIFDPDDRSKVNAMLDGTDIIGLDFDYIIVDYDTIDVYQGGAYPHSAR